MQELVKGSQDLLAGFRLIREPKLRLFVIIPLLINIVVFVLLITGLSGYFSGWVDGLMGLLPGWEWLAVLRWLMWLVFGFLVVLLIAYTFVFVATLIGAPFYGLLAAEVEKLLTGRSGEEPTSWGQVLASFPRSISRELAKLWYYVPRALALFLLCLVPFLSPVAPFIWAFFSGWTMALEFIDYPADNNGRSISDLKQFMKRHRGRTLGFGMLSWLCTLIPVLNLVSMQASVAGGVKFWLQAEGMIKSEPDKPMISD